MYNYIEKNRDDVKMRKLKFVLIGLLGVFLTKGEQIQAAVNINNGVITVTDEFLADDLNDDYGVISSVTETLVGEDGVVYDLTTEVIKEEFLPVDEAIKKMQRGNGVWTGCYASPGTYTIKATLNLNKAPFFGTLVGNTRFNLTDTSVAIQSLNVGGTTVESSNVTTNAKIVSSTFAQFNYTAAYPGNSIYGAQTKKYTIETELAHNKTSSGLMYRYKVDFYY